MSNTRTYEPMTAADYGRGITYPTELQGLFGFSDQSWGNDACARLVIRHPWCRQGQGMTREHREAFTFGHMSIWCAEPRREDREFDDGPRFMVTVHEDPDDPNYGGDSVFETDDPDALRAWFGLGGGAR